MAGMTEREKAKLLTSPVFFIRALYPELKLQPYQRRLLRALGRAGRRK